MNYEVVDLKGKKTGDKVELNDAVWAAPFNADLVAQVVNVFRSNQRSGTAHAKGKGDVSGGGKKPWRQKGTGRARHGSIRSPLWVGGGVTFLPNYRNWKRGINKKMKVNSLKSILSKRLGDNELMIVDFGKADRKSFEEKGKVLFVTSDKDTYMKFRNVGNVQLVSGMDLHTYDISICRKIYVDKEDLSKLEGRLS
ncbi:MAG: 50S ribosomal protein L4 [Candidatus Dojkabacteria bacterium]|nr:MAG: 50S ribosomal protein L4 [Candidatus Dojkabacteria bacterium]